MRTLIIAALALTSAACIPGNSPVRVVGTIGTDDMCKVVEEVQVFRGVLDVAGSGAYVVNLQLESELAMPVNQDQNGNNLVAPGANNWVADELLLSYTSKDPVITSFKAERVAIFGVVQPGMNGIITGNIITADALQRLRDAITAGMTPETTLNVRVEVRGHLESSTTLLGGVNTNPITFPITVRNSGTTCAGGTAPSCPPAGQDGAPITCCTAPGVPVGCP
jgi:hypothetical protein